MSQRANGQGCNCGACRGTGWLGFPKTIVDERGTRVLPWSGACYCAAGQYLTEDREPAKQGDPKPVRVTQAPREVYARRLAEADSLREASAQRRAA